MNRADYQRICRARLREANALFAAREYSGAYYLAGYVVECALKACICKNAGIKRYEFLERFKTENYYTHNAEKLIKTADLEADYEAEKKINLLFKANWDTVLIWSEESRYTTRKKKDAEELIDAIQNPMNGVLQWLERYW